MSTHSTIVPAPSTIGAKSEAELDQLKSYEFFQSHNHSVDELYLILQVLYDLSEQLWAHSRSTRCPLDVKALMQSISRPFSSFNRLGSYVTWGLTNISPLNLANNGFFYRESGTVS